MTILTRKERAYVAKLTLLNIELARVSSSSSDLWFKGLSKPMSCLERKMRSRIQRKAIAAMVDVALCGHAGLLPDRRTRKGGCTSVVGMFRDIDTFLMIQAMAEKTKSAQGPESPEPATHAIMEVETA